MGTQNISLRNLNHVTPSFSGSGRFLFPPCQVKEPYVIFCSLHWICPGPWHCDLSQLSNAVNNGALQRRNLQDGMINRKATFLSLSTLRQPSMLKSVIQSLALGAPGKCFSFSSPGCSFCDYCSTVDIEIPT